MEVMKGYKQTEVGFIPNEWQVKRLIELSSLITKGTTPRKFSTSGINYIKIESLFDDKIDIEKCLFIDEGINKNELKRSILNEGDLLFAIAGATIGKCTSVPKEVIPANTNQALAIIRLKEQEDRPYVFYFLKSALMQKYIIDNIAGGAQPNLNLAQIGKFFFPLPSSKVEQTAIATALSDTDALISSLEKLIAKKRNIKQGAMQELLKPKKGWEVKRLGEIAEVRDGTHQTPNYVEQGIPFYSVESVTNNNFTNTKFISEEEHRFLTKSFKIEKGDILMTRIGSIGDCKLIDWDVNASFYVSLALLKIKKEFSANFIYHYSKSSAFKKEVELNSLQTAIPKKINLGPISSVKIQLPDFQEQNRIGSILTDLETEIEILESKLEKFKLIKSGMMQNLLTGKIRLV